MYRELDTVYRAIRIHKEAEQQIRQDVLKFLHVQTAILIGENYEDFDPEWFDITVDRRDTTAMVETVISHYGVIFVVLLCNAYTAEDAREIQEPYMLELVELHKSGEMIVRQKTSVDFRIEENPPWKEVVSQLIM